MNLPKMMSKIMNKLNPDYMFTYQTRKLVHKSTGAGIDIVPLEIERCGRSMSQDGTIN
jgi:hypothetical protein